MNQSPHVSAAAVSGASSSSPAVSAMGGRRWIPAALQRWALMLFDQGVVSGTRFVTTIIVGRAAGADELGHYTVAFSVLVLLSCFQEALVTTPYAVYFHRLGRRSRAAYAGGSLVLHLLVIGGLGLVLLAAAGLTWLGGGGGGLARLMLIIAGTIPLSMMWEFARRSTLAQLKVGAAAGIDAAAAALQIGGLLWLAATQRLTAGSALATIATASLLVALTWLYRSRGLRDVRWAWMGRYWRRNWRLGRWLVASQMVGSLHGMLPSLMLALLAGASAAGVYAAHLNIALVAHPLMLAVSNLLMPRAAHAWSIGGVGAVVRLVRTAALAMTGVLAVFVATLALWGERIVSLVYGAKFAGQADVLVVLSASMIFWAVSVACACGLTALRYPRGSFVATLGGTCAAALTVLLLVPIWPVLGAAMGVFVGGATAAALHVAAFVRHGRELAGRRSQRQAEPLALEVRRPQEI